MDPFRFQRARDLSVPLLDRPGHICRERSHLDTVIQPIVYRLLACWLHRVHRLQITGMHNLPAQPPYILTANHSSHLDTPALMCALPAPARHAAYPLAAQDTFFDTPGRALLASKLVNALPIRRGRSDRYALSTIRDRLVEDRAVFLIYPEGTRGTGERIEPFRPGLGMLVAGTPIPVVPCRLRGCGQALPKGCWLPRRKRITLHIGEPLVFEDCQNTKSNWQSITQRVQHAVEAL